MTTPHRTLSPDELDQKLTRYAKVAIPIATVAVAAAMGGIFGAAPAILVLAGGALIGVIAIFWSSIRTLFGETRLAGADAYALGAPPAEEEKKRAVLRALKDLEFERSVGKISEEDYQALTAKYRAEAKRLLRLLDEGAEVHREQVETLVAKRFRREGLIDSEGDHPRQAEQTARRDPAERNKKGKKHSSKDTHEPDKRFCQACDTPNDVDAVFCKKCGARQLVEPRADDEAPEDRNADQEAGA